MEKIFIDGSAGTTGLQIRERLKLRNDIKILQIDEEKRKDISARLNCINNADIVFLWDRLVFLNAIYQRNQKL